MEIQLNIQPNLALAIIGALLIWQTLKLTYKHRSGNQFKNAVKNGQFFKRDIFDPTLCNLQAPNLSSADLTDADLFGATMLDGTTHD